MNLRKIAVVLVVGGALIATIGMGVGATFTASATASENINVGTFDIGIHPLDGTTVGSDYHVAVCPTISVQTSSTPVLLGVPVRATSCMFTLEQKGSIMPTHVTITATADGSGGVEMGKFTLYKLLDGAVGTFDQFAASGGKVIYDGLWLDGLQPASWTVGWSDLSNGSLGQTIHLYLTVVASE